MDNESSVSCPSCGAAADVTDAVCDLCGTPFHEEATAPADSAPAASEPMSSPGASGGGPFCYMCGTRNPDGARFCTACGIPLLAAQPASDTVPAKADRPGSARKSAARLAQQASSSGASPEPSVRPAGTQVLILMALAALVVVALFFITKVSKTRFPVEQEAVAETRSSANGTDARQADPQLTGELADAVARVEDELSGLEGEALRTKQEELLALLAGAGQPDRVAALQEDIARASNTAEAWKTAGNALYEWMEASGGEQRMDVAQRTADAYDKALSLGEDDLVVRTAMAMAFMNTRAPMQGVMQIRQVLETDPEHLEGNFYYGVMLMQINRLDQALAQFEKVKTLVGPEQPLYRQADMMIANIKTLGGNANS